MSTTKPKNSSTHPWHYNMVRKAKRKRSAISRGRRFTEENYPDKITRIIEKKEEVMEDRLKYY